MFTVITLLENKQTSFVLSFGFLVCENDFSEKSFGRTEQRTINWKPKSTGEGRFANWLENVNDWNLSRSRYWGIPLPIWRTEDLKEKSNWFCRRIGMKFKIYRCRFYDGKSFQRF